MISTSAKTKRRPKSYLTIETSVVACRSGSSTDLRTGLSHVRSSLSNGHANPALACPFGAINGHGRLFDHLIGAGKQRGRHGEVERFGGLEVDCQLEFRGYFDWQLTWLFAAQYSIDIECGTAEQVDI